MFIYVLICVFYVGVYTCDYGRIANVCAILRTYVCMYVFVCVYIWDDGRNDDVHAILLCVCVCILGMKRGDFFSCMILCLCVCILTVIVGNGSICIVGIYTGYSRWEHLFLCNLM